MKSLYNKRSDIVHARKLDVISEDQLARLRFYVREAIKRIMLLNTAKNDLCNLLDSSGFGESKNWHNSTFVGRL